MSPETEGLVRCCLGGADARADHRGCITGWPPPVAQPCHPQGPGDRSDQPGPSRTAHTGRQLLQELAGELCNAACSSYVVLGPIVSVMLLADSPCTQMLGWHLALHRHAYAWQEDFLTPGNVSTLAHAPLHRQTLLIDV